MISDQTTRNAIRQQLVNILNRLEGASSSGVEEEASKELWEEFFSLINQLDMELLPYGAVSQFVYKNANEDIAYFFEYIESKVEIRFSDTKDNNDYIKIVKLLEHLELANQQKGYLFLQQESDIRKIEKNLEEFYQVSSEIENIKSDFKEVKSNFEKIDKQINQITSNLISILGIFAAILIGAFGAIQAFSSLFTNAHSLSIGKLIIISSIGAAAVILILFFLLNGIAKLTDRNLWSTKEESSSNFKKYPLIVWTYSAIVFTALIGAALELSNFNMKFAWEGLWWLLPIIWGITCYFSYNKLFKKVD